MPATANPAASADTTNKTPAPARLTSLDAFRGFIMFWIIGGDSIGHALEHWKAADSGLLHLLASQLNHVQWEGFRFYDLIFPSFVFIVGVSIVFSLTRSVAKHGKAATARKVIVRAGLLWLIGVLYYGGISKGIDGVRLLGVLQRIALCYLAAGLFFIYLKPRGLMIACAAILIGYWAMLTFIAIPGMDHPSFEEGKNLTNWMDREYLPFFKWDGDHDPEGMLSTLPAVATCLLGVFAGLLFQSGAIPKQRKTLLLLGAGVASVILGHLWGLQFPVIKKLWTSSYVLVAGGWSAILLAAFYWVIDVRGVSRWAQPFIWIGMNPITIYLLSNVIQFDAVAGRVLGGPVAVWLDARSPGLGELVISCGGMAIAVWICWFMHRRKLFLRL